jgi:hypothetical protein
VSEASLDGLDCETGDTYPYGWIGDSAMQKYRVRLTTTHVDKQGERVSLPALEQFVGKINGSFIPVGAHHDPRIAPQGRVLEAAVERLEDGEYAATGTIELFEEGDVPPRRAERRSIPDRRPDAPLGILYDHSFKTGDVLQELDRVASAVGAPCSQDLKKSMEILPVLTILGIAGVALKSFVEGFFNEAGAAAWNTLREQIPKLLQRLRGQRGEIQETLLLLRVVSPDTSPYYCVEVVVPDPSENELEQLRAEAVPLIDSIVASLMERYPEVKHLVFEYSGGTLKLLYGVRSDAAPLFPDSPCKPTKLIARVRNAVHVDVGMGMSLAGVAARVQAFQKLETPTNRFVPSSQNKGPSSNTR